ncbi:hypothetical protein ABH935_009794 [Catenulispora sp. GAS73]|uniref:hypothetical protein n=1 Tax=Catenulispora sp. GAS73 TaxID=3156269 RepID=UPI0035172497
MFYNVTVEIAPPHDTVPLDALRSVGAATLLDAWLSHIEGAEVDEDDEDGSTVDLARYKVATHASGAVLNLLVDAETLSDAEAAARDIAEAACEYIEPLESWQVTRAQVELDTTDAEEQLAEADRWSLDEAALEAGGKVEDERGITRELILAAGKHLRAFEPDDFAGGEDASEAKQETARLCMGALMWTCETVIDDLFADIADLAEVPGANAAILDDSMRVLSQLPAQHAHLYTRLFAQKFMLALTAVVDRLCRDQWDLCASVAEELALRLLIENADVVLDLVSRGDEDTDAAFACFEDCAFEDADHEYLFDPAMDGVTPEAMPQGFGMAPMDFGSWFVPFNDTRPVNPYCLPDGEREGSSTA